MRGVLGSGLARGLGRRVACYPARMHKRHIVTSVAACLLACSSGQKSDIQSAEPAQSNTSAVVKSALERVTTLAEQPEPWPPAAEVWNVVLEAPRAPFKTAYVGENEVNGGGMLVVELDDGWFGWWDMFEYPGNNKYHRTEAAISLVGSGQDHVLRIDLTQGRRENRDSIDGMGQWFFHEETTATFCGVGPSGKPSCTAPLMTRREWGSENSRGSESGAKARTVEFTTGKLTVTEDGQTSEHALTFP